ncbi:S-layer homology domain-containing protein [Ornithinibacillus californiensis]|uniref:S-layer homology domain-containing protein n=1 Tax=Ornithinibacillus californiensis TaxID=161536 RepID=UPI00064D8780|nr:S-layer homology domain-containing protein [Ornithinibacillus californiensis]
MANHKSYKKFAASAMAATTVVAAVAPSVLAADINFTDVKSGDSHYEGIQFLAEKGIKGYADGSFGVSKELTRPHAAIMFVNALGLERPNASEVGSYFTDVSADDLYADYIAAVAEAGVFKGSNRKYLPNEPLSRQQMASTLVNAFDLDTIKVEKEVKINLDNVAETHKANVQILANLGITNQLDDFRPGEAVTRGQFATFLYKANLAVSPIEVNSVSAITTLVDDSAEETLAFAINGDSKAADLAAVERAGYKVEFQATSDIFAAKDASGQPTTAITSNTGKLVSNLTVGNTFSYKVVVSDKEGKVVAESALQQVKVEDLDSQYTSIDSYVLKAGELELKNSKTVLVGETLNISAVEGTTKAGNKEQAIATDGYSVESSNPSVAYVSADGVVTTLKAGTTTITIKAGDVTKSFTLTVSADEKRVASNVTIDGSVKLTTDNEKALTLKVTDQFGEVYTGDVYVKLPTVKVENTDVNLVDLENTTLNVADGQASFTVVAGDYAGKGNLVISDKETDGNTLATVSVDISNDVKVATRLLEVVGGESADLAIDYYTIGSSADAEKDSTVTFALNKYNAAGYYIGEELIEQKAQTADQYTVQVENNIEANVTVVDNKITVAAGQKAGEVKVTISYGATELVTKTVSVKNSTPVINDVSFKSVSAITKADETVNAATVLSINEDTNQVSGVTVSTGEKVYFDSLVLYVDKDGEKGYTKSAGDISVGSLAWVADSTISGVTANTDYQTKAGDKGNIIFTLSNAQGTVDTTAVSINIPQN